MLAERIEAARAGRLAVEIALPNSLQRRPAFDDFETVCGNQNGTGRRIVTMICTADPLDQPFDVLRRADLDHQIDIPPVDTEIERPGADYGPQSTLGHRRLDTRPHFPPQRAVVKADGQGLAVFRPERLEKELGCRTGVDEDQRRACGTDQFHHIRCRVAAATARPRWRHPGLENRDVWVRPRISLGNTRALSQKPRKGGRILHRCRQADAAEAGCDALEPGEPQHQLFAPRRLGQGVDLVDDHPSAGPEDRRRLRVGQHQGQGFGSCQQDMRWIYPLARPLGGPGVAGTILDPDGQAHLGHGLFEITPDIGREGLER